MHVVIDGERGSRRSAGKPAVWRDSPEPSVTLGQNIQSDKPNISNFSIIVSPSSPAVILETCRRADKVALQT